MDQRFEKRPHRKRNQMKQDKRGSSFSHTKRSSVTAVLFRLGLMRAGRWLLGNVLALQALGPGFGAATT